VAPPERERLCACGCGQVTPIAKRTDTAKGYIKGWPKLYVTGHYAGRATGPGSRGGDVERRRRESLERLERWREQEDPDHRRERDARNHRRARRRRAAG
jgi:hypothetical protein